MESYIARQPIFNRDKTIFGYELLFRDGMDNFVPDIDGDEATSKLLSSSFFNMGIETLADGKQAFINFTRNLLIKQIPLIFPKETTVVEVLEDVEPDPDVIHACRSAREHGYTIALDDFIYRPDLKPLISLADIIKIDFRAILPEDMQAHLQPVRLPGIRLLAEKVETPGEFQNALDLGFEYFQGYFFCKPEIVRGKDIPSSQMSLLQIMAEANREDMNFDRIKSIVEKDMALSYKLLHYINSAFFRRVHRISSIRQALTYIGEKEIRRFISMIAMAGLVRSKPDELVRISFTRAKFLESLSRAGSIAIKASERFTLGLFSLIDAILDRPMDRIMKQLPLTEEIVDALVYRKGTLARYLALAEKYERGNWEEIPGLTTACGLDEARLPDIFLSSCQWANALAAL